MINEPKIAAVAEELDPWDSGELGREAGFVQVASDQDDDAIDVAIGMQMISIRLSKSLIRDLKLIAKYRNVGYQPMMRDILCRFARSELSQIARELTEEQAARTQVEAALVKRA